MSTNSERTDVYQVITDRIISLLEQGVSPWHQPWSSGRGPSNLVSKKEYRGINTFLLLCAPYASPYWLTFKQAREKGGHVRKGEKGFPVIFWKLYERENRADPEKTDQVPVLRYYTVFNIEQCEGIEAPAPEVSRWDHDPIEQAEAIQLAMPNRPVVKAGQFAGYNHASDMVMIPELKRFEKPEEYYSTLFHELTHATGHSSRLNRDAVTGHHAYGSTTYSKKELVAEMGSAFLCAHCGIEQATIENSAAYLQGWIKALRGDKKLVITAAAQAQKAADYILNRQD